MMLSATLVLSSCNSYTATGAYTGAEFGHIIGSAIGGITGGWRGHDVGSLIGTVGGAVAGAAVGAAIENAEKAPTKREAPAHAPQYETQQRNDDVIDFDGMNGYEDLSNVIIRHLTLREQTPDHRLTRGEEATLVFDLMNGSENPVYEITPVVEEITGNKHIHISPNLVVHQIAPYQGVRYTATVKADKGLKDGVATLRIGVKGSDGRAIASPMQVSIKTQKK